MATDFGDESGGQLYDWMLRVGQDAGREAMLASADKLAAAFKNAREGLHAQTGDKVNEWAKLSMKSFIELPEYESLKQLISSELESRGITHDFSNEDGMDYLVFKVKDSHEIASSFEKLESSTRAAKAKAQKDAPGADRDAEQLEQRAEAARGASKALEAMKGTDRNIQLSQNISK